MKQAIKKWWDGEYVPFKNTPNSGVVFLNGGHFERHWSSIVAHVVIGFWLKYWQWTIGVLVAIFFGFWKS